MILLSKFCSFNEFSVSIVIRMDFKNDNEDAALMRFEAAMGSCR
jgi:hypothetical protein